MTDGSTEFHDNYRLLEEEEKKETGTFVVCFILEWRKGRSPVSPLKKKLPLRQR
jgi:hypothetical protein